MSAALYPAMMTAGFPAAVPLFSPTYEWLAVPDDWSVPAGLELKLDLQSSKSMHRPRLARIPPTWRLAVWINEAHFFARVDVQRSTTVGSLENEVSEQVSQRRRKVHGAVKCSVMLWSNGERLLSSASAEEIGLFGRQRTLVPRVACT